MTLPDTSLLQTLMLFFASATIVWFSGARLAYLSDALSERYGLAKSLIGLVFLALATSLPEVATTLTAAAQQAKDLVLNNLFGGIALQTAILAMSDFWARGAITNYPRKANHALEATLLVTMLGLTSVVIILGEPISFWGIGLGSTVIAICYCGAIWLLRVYDGASDWVPVDLPAPNPESSSPRDISAELGAFGLLPQTLLACLAILVFGTGLVLTAERLAFQSGLGESFIGVTLLAGATSLPELTTSIAAVRLGAYTMAISNIFGSNLIMLVLVFPADLLFRSGPILQDPSATVGLALGFGIIVTSLFLTGLIVRRKPKIGKVGVDSVLVLIAFGISLGAYYIMR